VFPEETRSRLRLVAHEAEAELSFCHERYVESSNKIGKDGAMTLSWDSYPNAVVVMDVY